MSNVAEIKASLANVVQVLNTAAAEQAASKEHLTSAQQEAIAIGRAAAAALRRLNLLQEAQETHVSQQAGIKEELLRAVGQLAATLDGSSNPEALEALAQATGLVDMVDDHIGLVAGSAVETGNLAGLVKAVEDGAGTSAQVTALSIETVENNIGTTLAVRDQLEAYAGNI